jgi:hypothetical protein
MSMTINIIYIHTETTSTKAIFILDQIDLMEPTPNTNYGI